MNTPGSYQKAPIGTSNRLVIVWFIAGGDSVSIRTEMVAKDPRLGFSLFLGGGNFRRNRDKLEPSGGNRCCDLSSLLSYDIRGSSDEKVCGFTLNLDELVAK